MLSWLSSTLSGLRLISGGSGVAVFSLLATITSPSRCSSEQSRVAVAVIAGVAVGSAAAAGAAASLAAASVAAAAEHVLRCLHASLLSLRRALSGRFARLFLELAAAVGGAAVGVALQYRLVSSLPSTDLVTNSAQIPRLKHVR